MDDNANNNINNSVPNPIAAAGDSSVPTPSNNTQNNSGVPASAIPPVADPSGDPAIVPEAVSPEDLDLQWRRWKCLNCGYVYEGREPLVKCPRCGNEDPDKFQDVD